MGPILHPAQLTFYTDACVVASLQLAQSVLFPPAPRVGKLGNDLAPQGAARRKEDVLAQTFPGAILTFQKPLAGNTWFKVLCVVRCSDAILRAHA